jgi:hypothetical protein
LAIYFLTLKELPGSPAAGKFLVREEEIVLTIDFALPRLASGGGDAEHERQRAVPRPNQLAHDGRFPRARGAGDDDQVATALRGTVSHRPRIATPIMTNV